MVRKIGMVLVPIAVVLFAATFIHVVSHNEVSGSCTGAECLRGENRWALGFPASIFLFMGGAFAWAFGGNGLTRPQGPDSFDDVRAGRGSAPEAAGSSSGTRPAKRWTRSWANAYSYTAAGELFLAALFFYAGIRVPSFRSGGFVTGAVLGGIGVLFGIAGRRVAASDRLHDKGLPGRAQIVSILQPNYYVNGNPVVVLTLNVQLEGYPAYRVKHRETVPMVMLGRLTDGLDLPVKVDPDNPSRLIIEWEQA